jgi:hypothetical protein
MAAVFYCSLELFGDRSWPVSDQWIVLVLMTCTTFSNRLQFQPVETAAVIRHSNIYIQCLSLPYVFC